MKDKKVLSPFAVYLILITQAFNSILVMSYQYLFYSGLVGLMLNVTVNNYGHVELVSSPCHTFFSGQA